MKISMEIDLTKVLQGVDGNPVREVQNILELGHINPGMGIDMVIAGCLNDAKTIQGVKLNFRYALEEITKARDNFVKHYGE